MIGVFKKAPIFKKSFILYCFFLVFAQKIATMEDNAVIDTENSRLKETINRRVETIYGHMKPYLIEQAEQDTPMDNYHQFYKKLLLGTLTIGASMQGMVQSEIEAQEKKTQQAKIGFITGYKQCSSALIKYTTAKSSQDKYILNHHIHDGLNAMHVNLKLLDLYDEQEKDYNKLQELFEKKQKEKSVCEIRTCIDEVFKKTYPLISNPQQPLKLKTSCTKPKEKPMQGKIINNEELVQYGEKLKELSDNFSSKEYKQFKQTWEENQTYDNAEKLIAACGNYIECAKQYKEQLEIELKKQTLNSIKKEKFTKLKTQLEANILACTTKITYYIETSLLEKNEFYPVIENQEEEKKNQEEKRAALKNFFILAEDIEYKFKIIEQNKGEKCDYTRNLLIQDLKKIPSLLRTIGSSSNNTRIKEINEIIHNIVDLKEYSFDNMQGYYRKFNGVLNITKQIKDNPLIDSTLLFSDQIKNNNNDKGEHLATLKIILQKKPSEIDNSPEDLLMSIVPTHISGTNTLNNNQTQKQNLTRTYLHNQPVKEFSPEIQNDKVAEDFDHNSEEKNVEDLNRGYIDGKFVEAVPLQDKDNAEVKDSNDERKQNDVNKQINSSDTKVNPQDLNATHTDAATQTNGTTTNLHSLEMSTLILKPQESLKQPPVSKSDDQYYSVSSSSSSEELPKKEGIDLSKVSILGGEIIGRRDKSMDSTLQTNETATNLDPLEILPDTPHSDVPIASNTGQINQQNLDRPHSEDPVTENPVSLEDNVKVEDCNSNKLTENPQDSSSEQLYKVTFLMDNYYQTITYLLSKEAFLDLMEKNQLVKQGSERDLAGTWVKKINPSKIETKVNQQETQHLTQTIPKNYIVTGIDENAEVKRYIVSEKDFLDLMQNNQLVKKDSENNSFEGIWVKKQNDSNDSLGTKVNPEYRSTNTDFAAQTGVTITTSPITASQKSDQLSAIQIGKLTEELCNVLITSLDKTYRDPEINETTTTTPISVSQENNQDKLSASSYLSMNQIDGRHTSSFESSDNDQKIDFSRNYRDGEFVESRHSVPLNNNAKAKDFDILPQSNNSDVENKNSVSVQKNSEVANFPAKKTEKRKQSTSSSSSSESSEGKERNEVDSTNVSYSKRFILNSDYFSSSSSSSSHSEEDSNNGKEKEKVKKINEMSDDDLFKHLINLDKKDLQDQYNIIKTSQNPLCKQFVSLQENNILSSLENLYDKHCSNNPWRSGFYSFEKLSEYSSNPFLIHAIDCLSDDQKKMLRYNLIEKFASRDHFKDEFLPAFKKLAQHNKIFDLFDYAVDELSESVNKLNDLKPDEKSMIIHWANFLLSLISKTADFNQKDESFTTTYNKFSQLDLSDLVYREQFSSKYVSDMYNIYKYLSPHNITLRADHIWFKNKLEEVSQKPLNENSKETSLLTKIGDHFKLIRDLFSKNTDVIDIKKHLEEKGLIPEELIAFHDRLREDMNIIKNQNITEERYLSDDSVATNAFNNLKKAQQNGALAKDVETKFEQFKKEQPNAFKSTYRWWKPWTWRSNTVETPKKQEPVHTNGSATLNGHNGSNKKQTNWLGWLFSWW